MITKFRTKLVLAAASGALVPLSVQVYDRLTASNEWLEWLFGFGLPGALFAVAVLWPYLDRDRSFYLRGVALIGASVLSYWCANQTAIEFADISFGMFGPHGSVGWDAWVAASLVGAVIILLAAKLIIPLRWSLVYLLLGLLASVLGGLIFHWSEDADWPQILIAYALWHSLVCAAIHFGSPSTESGARLSSVLLPRFKISLIVLIVFIILPPLADVAVGYGVFRYHDLRYGGIQIHERVAVPGLLIKRPLDHQRSSNCGMDCMTWFLDGKYAYQEYFVTNPRMFLYSLGKGYQHYYVATKDDPNCNPIIDPSMNQIFWGSKDRDELDDDHCLAVRATGEPISAYALRSRETTVPAVFGLYPLEMTKRQVIRIDTDEVIAESVYYMHHPRIFWDEFGTREPWLPFVVDVLPPDRGDWTSPE